MSDKKTFRYSGKACDVAWHGGLCIHVGECGGAAGDLFVGGRDPWCSPDMAADKDEIIDVIKRCPTGALSVVEDGAAAAEEPAEENTVVVANDGPLYISGELEIDAATEDMPSVRYRAALCRCGASKNKPFCDNSHEKAGFRDHGAVGDSGKPLEHRGGPLTVKGAPNGPLLVNGNFRIVAASGRVAWTGTKAALCRCGESKNKPFCDGSHKAAGFVAD